MKQTGRNFKDVNRYLIHPGLFISGATTVFSGLLIQVNYHMRNHGLIEKSNQVFNIQYQGWTMIHKISIIALSLLMVYHIYHHRKWYMAVISKKLIIQNQQVLVLSLLFFLVAISGLTPWLMTMLHGDEMMRRVFIEIHDKLAILLSVYLFLHIFRRWKWFFLIFKKAENN